MMAKLRALVCLLVVFLPLVVKGGEPEPFSVSLSVDSYFQRQYIEEPFVQVAVYSTQNPEMPLFQGYTTGSGYLSFGLYTNLPQSLYLHVWREKGEGVLQHPLPLLVSETEAVDPYERLNCYADYNWDTDTHEVDCYTWLWAIGEAPSGEE